MTSFTFTKEERLKSRKVIGQLFKEGHSFTSFPLRLVWIKTEQPQEEIPLKITVSVPKRSFPKAVHRNLLRRRVREAYRLNKHIIFDELKKEKNIFGLMLIYISKEKQTYQEIEKATIKGLKRLVKEIQKV